VRAARDDELADAADARDDHSRNATGVTLRIVRLERVDVAHARRAALAAPTGRRVPAG